MSDTALNFQLFFEESPDVLLVLLPDSPRFTAVAATKARLESTHSTAQETLGRGLFELFPDNPDDPEAHATANLRASLERVLATRAADTMAVQKYDIPLPGGGFEAKFWSPRNIPILSSDGEVAYILHRAVDVTELARASEEGEELRGRTADMEREVVRRSQELDAANRKLREANDRLSELDAAKTAFFSNISHEFRTPLTLMLGPLEDALAAPGSRQDPAQRERLQVAYDNALRLLKLVSALLDFSRLEAGKIAGNFAPVDVARLTRELTAMFQVAFDRTEVAFEVDCPTLTAPLWLDADLWETIVSNLLSNAFKFTLHGKVSVRLRETKTQALLEVTDTGPGIAAADIARVFERFHRLAAAPARTHEGAGIGLALVKELVELHGGTVSLSSIEGSGSTFCLCLPKGSAHLPAGASSPRGAEPRARRNAAHAVEAARWVDKGTVIDSGPSDRPRVCVVDDNADLRNHIGGLLESEFQVVSACDGQRAFELIQERAPDIVLCDVMMPRMSGIELVRALRADPALVGLPVILLSARAGEAAAAEGLDAGADDYLTKPFSAGELLTRVRALLKLAQLRRKCTADLEIANRELDAFSYSVAHDLRGPLRSINGFSDLLLAEHSQQLDAEGRRLLHVVRNAAQRMSTLIEDLLRLSTMSRGDIRRMRFDLSSVVRTVAEQIRSSEPGHVVSLTVQDGVSVHADPHMLQIVLDNLLRNAWKFTSKRSGAEVEFGSAVDDGEPCYYVRDNGAGFNMAYASKLFGVFQRMHSEQEFPGTGIGLATVKRIIGRHGGRVWAQAAVGEGAALYFTLGSPAELGVAELGTPGQSSVRA
jgi:signal transduction histidine kinase